MSSAPAGILLTDHRPEPPLAGAEKGTAVSMLHEMAQQVRKHRSLPLPGRSLTERGAGTFTARRVAR